MGFLSDFYGSHTVIVGIGDVNKKVQWTAVGWTAVCVFATLWMPIAYYVRIEWSIGGILTVILWGITGVLGLFYTRLTIANESLTIDRCFCFFLLAKRSIEFNYISHLEYEINQFGPNQLRIHSRESRIFLINDLSDNQIKDIIKFIGDRIKCIDSHNRYKQESGTAHGSTTPKP